MIERQLTQDHLTAYAGHLLSEERSGGTIEKYVRDAGAFARWLAGEPVTRERAAAWREHLASSGYAPVTVNSMLAAVNGLFRTYFSMVPPLRSSERRCPNLPPG